MKSTVVRRGLAWLLVLVMALSAVPFGVFAESTEQASNAGPEEAPGGVVSPVEPQQEEPKPEEPKQEEPKVQDIQDEDTQVEAAQKCLCEDAAKCTEDFMNEKCPVCAEKDADLEKVCKGKTQEQLNVEAEAKKAEEEAAKKAAEEAAQNASEEAVKNVQALIDALPEAETITEENREAVETALNAIDDAKEKLTDEERGKLDFTRYDAAAEALNALEGIPGAGAPVTLEESGDEPESGEITIDVQIGGDWLDDATSDDRVYSHSINEIKEKLIEQGETSGRYILKLTGGRETNDIYTISSTFEKENGTVVELDLVIEVDFLFPRRNAGKIPSSVTTEGGEYHDGMDDQRLIFTYNFKKSWVYL